MTLTELAALLDSLKRPIEEAPRDGRAILGIYKSGYTDAVSWCDKSKCWLDMRNRGCSLTHFLPLPAAGDCPFEVVPRGLVEDAYREGWSDCDFPRSNISDDWNESDAKKKLEANNG